MEPEGEASDVEGGEEGFAVFGVSCGDSAPAFEMQECIFDQMAKFVEILIVSPLNDTVFLRRNHGDHALGRRLGQNRVDVITLVRQQTDTPRSSPRSGGLHACNPRLYLG